MKIKKLLIVLVLAVALLGCGKREPRHIIIMPDISGSIERESLEEAFKAIDELADHLQRGDKLTIIPILGDAEAEASGRILRFEVPANRQAYDADLRDFRGKLNFALKKMEAEAAIHPGSKTDILGSLALVQQEFLSDPMQSNKSLILLSDFIQDDGILDFGINAHFANRITAKQFAEQIVKSRPLDFTRVDVYAGLLRSIEYAHMPKLRREGIEEFWLEYFKECGARPKLAADGPGLILK